MSCDFVPDECNALAMQLCLQARACLTGELDLEGINETFGKVTNLFAGADVRLSDKHECLKSALKAAFDAVGCPFPLEPPRPAPPDFSQCKQILDDLRARAADPLSALGDTMTITLDSNLRPIRVVVP